MKQSEPNFAYAEACTCSACTSASSWCSRYVPSQKRLLSCFLGHIIYALRRNVNGGSGEKRKGFALFFVHRSNKSVRNGQDPPPKSPQPHSAAVKMRSAHLTGRAFYGSIALIKGSNRRDPPRPLRQYGFCPQTTEIVRLLPEHRICSGKGLFFLFTSQTTCKEDILWHSFFQT